MATSLAAALLGSTLIGGVADPDTVTSQEADMSVNDNIRDWKSHLGMLDPVHSAALDVWVCGEHLPTGSPTRANLEAAVAEWNNLVGVNLFGTVKTFPGTWNHPSSRPTNFTGVYVDYDDTDGAWAQMDKAGCGVSLDKDPKECDRLYLDLDPGTYATAMANPNEVDSAVSTWIFAHELAHGWGLGHPAPDYDENDPQHSVQTIRMDGATNHSDKYHVSGRAWPTTVGTAKDYAWMRHYYSGAAGNLSTDELIVHPIMSLALSEEVTAELTFWRGYTRGQIENWDNWNQTSVYWSSTANAFLRCSDDALEHDWMARFSEVSINTIDTPFSVGYRLSTNGAATTWVTLTEKGGVSSHITGTVFNQKTYEGDFTLDATNTGITPATMPNRVKRKLQFVADLYANLTERSELNNVLEATICFFKDKSKCGECEQSTQGNLGVGEPCFDDGDCESNHCEWVYGESGFETLCNEVECGECEFDSDPTNGTCAHNGLPDGHRGNCDEPEVCMGGQCTSPGTCSGGACAPDCSVIGPVTNNCSPGFTAAGYCPAESQCAGGQFECDCRP